MQNDNVQPPPQSELTDDVAATCAKRLSLMKFFPGPYAIPVIALELKKFCANNAKAIRMTDSVLQENSEWCGVAGLRAVYRHWNDPLDEKPLGHAPHY